MTPGTIAADVVREECRGSSRTVTLNGIQVDLDERGSGRPILFLHPETGPDQHVPVLDLLAQKSRLIAPSHPGFGRSPAAPSITTVDDLAYLYLDLLKALDLRNVCVVGISLGAWIAAEIAIKSTERLSSMIFANPIGIKVGGREQRDIKDIFALREEEYLSSRLFGHVESRFRLQRSVGRQASGDCPQPGGDGALLLVALHA